MDIVSDDFYTTVYDFLHWNSVINSFDLKKNLDEIKHLTSACSFECILKKKIVDLSPQEIQLVKLMNLFLKMPSLIVMTDPFHLLDPQQRDIIKKHILHLQKKGTTTLLITDDLTSIEIANTVAFLKDGKIITQGKSIAYRDMVNKRLYALECKGSLSQTMQSSHKPSWLHVHNEQNATIEVESTEVINYLNMLKGIGVQVTHITQLSNRDHIHYFSAKFNI